MAERSKFEASIGGSGTGGTGSGSGSGPAAPRANFPNSPACGHWETLLVDALDGLLSPEDEATFSSHMAGCEACTEMFEQARRGREWLEYLAPEPHVPALLLDKILAQTGPGKQAPGELTAAVAPGGIALAGASGSATSGVVNRPRKILPMTAAWQRPGFSGRMRRFAEPRLLMTAAMAFFSIALTMSLTGVRIARLHMADLRPAAVRSAVEKRVMTASTPIVRYYDHLRFVYEVESRMKELRRNSELSQPSPAQPGQSRKPSAGESQKKDGGSSLNPGEAPQQTVNPPSLLWSPDLLQASIGLQPLPAPGLANQNNPSTTQNPFPPLSLRFPDPLAPLPPGESC